MKADKIFAKKIKERFGTKQDSLARVPAIMGSNEGPLRVPGLANWIYVTIGDKVEPVFCNRITPEKGVKVWVGYDSTDKKLRQVLATRGDSPSGVDIISGGGFAPARRYEWLAKNGGQDPLHVHLRAFSPLKIGVSALGGLNVNLFNGYVYSGTAWIHVDRQDLDMTAHIPSTAGKCALVLVTIDNTGAAVMTKGSEVDIAALTIANLPAIPANTVFISGAARVYNGQTIFQERKTNTDFVDLRFTGLSGDTVSIPAHNDTTGKQGGTSGEYYHLTSAQSLGLTGSGGTVLHFHAHNNMSDIQGGTSGEYYHLTSAQALDLTDGGSTTLHSHTAGGTAFQRTLSANLSLADGESLVIADYIDANGFDITLAGDSEIALIGGGTYPIRTYTVASSATPTINTDLYDVIEITAQAVDITSMTTNLSGTPGPNQQLQIYITGTAARAITWGASYESGIATLPGTTTGTETLEVGFRRNNVTNKWRCQSSGSA